MLMNMNAHSKHKSSERRRPLLIDNGKVSDISQAERCSAERPPIPGSEDDRLTAREPVCSQVSAKFPTHVRSSLVHSFDGRDCTNVPGSVRPDRVDWLDLSKFDRHKPEKAQRKWDKLLTWEKSFTCLLDDIDGVKLFQKFLEEEMSSSTCLDYWFACQALQGLLSPEETVTLIKLLHKRYFGPDNCLQLSRSLVKKISQQIEQKFYSPELFLVAQSAVEKLMRHFLFPLFLRSEIYKQYKRVQTDIERKSNAEDNYWRLFSPRRSWHKSARNASSNLGSCPKAPHVSMVATDDCLTDSSMEVPVKQIFNQESDALHFRPPPFPVRHYDYMLSRNDPKEFARQLAVRLHEVQEERDAAAERKRSKSLELERLTLEIQSERKKKQSQHSELSSTLHRNTARGTEPGGEPEKPKKLVVGFFWFDDPLPTRVVTTASSLRLGAFKKMLPKASSSFRYFFRAGLDGPGQQPFEWRECRDNDEALPTFEGKVVGHVCW